MMVAGAIAFAFLAFQAAAPAAAPGAQDLAASDKKICKAYAATTGTRFGKKRICKTQAEWNLLADDQKNTMDRIQRINVGKQGG